MIFGVTRLLGGIALPVVIATGLAFAWSLKRSLEEGAAATTQMRIEREWREQDRKEQERLYQAGTESAKSIREKYAHTEQLLREEVDRLKARPMTDDSCWYVPDNPR